MADQSRANFRINVIAEQVSRRLLREGSMFAGRRASHLHTETSPQLPPPVSRAAMRRFVQLCMRVIFPEFNNCSEDDDKHGIKGSTDVADYLGEAANVLKEQLVIAERLVRYDEERIKERRKLVSQPPNEHFSAKNGSGYYYDSNDIIETPNSALKPTINGTTKTEREEMAPPPPVPMAARYASKVDAIVGEFFERLPKLQALLNTDVDAILERDVATSCRTEVVLAYPSVLQMTHHRIAHELYVLGAPDIMTRLISEIAHSMTGIDIHPHVSIGHHFFIDHGTGIVIGGTARIGNFVSIYQGVTLGAKSFRIDPLTGKRIKNLPRHPIVEDHVTLYANCCVLGRVTVGQYSTVGGNVFVTKDVKPGSTVMQGKATVTSGKVPKGDAGRIVMPTTQVLMQDGSGI